MIVKKDHIIIGEILRETNAPQSTIYAFTEFLKKDNPKFDVETFLLFVG